MRESLLGVLQRKTYLPSTAAELLQELRLPHSRLAELHRLLHQLEQAGEIARVKGNRYALSRAADLLPGRIRMNRQGKGFFTADDPQVGELHIPESQTGTALHEDRVLVRPDVSAWPRPSEEGAPATGTVLRVLERQRADIVGTFQRSARFAYVIPDDPRIPHDLYVPEPRDVGRPARVGDKVVVRLREWESRHTNPEGEIIEVLGPPDAEGVDMLSVLRHYRLPLHFPRRVLDEARGFAPGVGPADRAGREDCRRHPVITIDPDDAKDFDDAICLEPAGEGQWKLWVHIADVSHYVRPGTALDEEARRRGNSTYLVDRVIPMLPEALSNELCSLKPHVDRLTKCVEFLIAPDGRVLRSRAFPAVIHSQRRLTYGEALGILQRRPADALERMLHDAHELAQRLRRRRFQAGSLDLDFPEMKVRLDEAGRVARIERMENDISHQLIEEFMLLANEAVASRLLHLRRPAVHRVHEEPDPRRLQEYRQEVLAHHVPCGNLSHRPEVQKLLRRLDTLPVGPALKIGFLRSLRRARYAVESLGHYGLAKQSYTHFTSPIRRYADLVVHRALFERGPATPAPLHETADHLSATERNSADAERDSRDAKLFAFLEGQLSSPSPTRYPALVTDLRNFGFGVDVTGLGMSGMVPFSQLKDDFYVFDTARRQVIGRRHRRMIRMGDRIEVQIARVDRFKKQVDFRLAAAGTGKLTPARSETPGHRPPHARHPHARPPHARPGPQPGAKSPHSSRASASASGSPTARPQQPRPAQGPRREQPPRRPHSHSPAPAQSHGPGQGQRHRQGRGPAPHPSHQPRDKRHDHGRGRGQGHDRNPSRGPHPSQSPAQGRPPGPAHGQTRSFPPNSGARRQEARDPRSSGRQPERPGGQTERPGGPMGRPGGPQPRRDDRREWRARKEAKPAVSGRPSGARPPAHSPSTSQPAGRSPGDTRGGRGRRRW